MCIYKITCKPMESFAEIVAKNLNLGKRILPPPPLPRERKGGGDCDERSYVRIYFKA